MTKKAIALGILYGISLLLATGSMYSKGKDKKRILYPVQTQKPALILEKDITYTPVTWPTSIFKLYDTVRITFIGDVMQHGRQLESALAENASPDTPNSYNYDHTFRHIEEELTSADLAVANMEFPLGTPPYKGYPVFSAPESIAWKAQECGIDLFLLANNHILDKGKRGLLNTLDVYEKMGGTYIGAYRNSQEEEKMNPVMFNVKGIRVAFINFTYGTNGFAVPEPCKVNLMDSLHVKETIAKAKSMGADMIICMPHWGEEYQLRPSAHQKKWAKMLQREGVQVIMGSHPHVPQSAEISPDNILFYSLGNYISNQTTPDYTQLELMVTISVVKNFHTGKTTLLQPEYEFLWCFKKNEFAQDYTVVPVKDIIGKPEMVKDQIQYRRMENTYNAFIKQNLIKTLTHPIYGREKN